MTNVVLDEECKDESKSTLFKTRLCALFPSGRCTRGSRCNFAHSQNELQKQPDLRKTSLCTRFMRSGKCDSDRCPFAHGYDDLRHTPELYKTSLCTFWEFGNCQYGNFCRHAHGQIELRTIGSELPNNYYNYMNHVHGFPYPMKDLNNNNNVCVSDSLERNRELNSKHEKIIACEQPPQYKDFKSIETNSGFENEHNVIGWMKESNKPCGLPTPKLDFVVHDGVVVRISKPYKDSRCVQGYLELKPNERVQVVYAGSNDDAEWCWGRVMENPARSGWFPKDICMSENMFVPESNENKATREENKETNTQCSVCHKKESTHAIVPCGHQCVCGECSDNLPSCPVCFSLVMQVIRVIVV